MAFQVAKAKKALRQAISTVNVGEHEEIKKAAARACVSFGLKQRAQAFELVPVSFCQIGEEPALKAAVSASLLRTKRLRNVFEKKDLPSFFTIGLADHNPTLQLNIHRWFSQASPDLQFSLAMSAQGGSHGSSISPMASSSTDSATTQLPSASLDPSLSDLQPVQSVLQLLPLYVKVAIERELGLAGNSLHVRYVHISADIRVVLLLRVSAL